VSKTVPAAITEPTDTATVPATFLPTPDDAPCETYPWCAETGDHIDHMSRRVSLPTADGLPPILTAHLYTDEPAGLPELNFDPGHDDWREGITGDQLRAEVTRIRTHLVRLDAFADEYDAITEAGTAGVLHPAKAYVTEQGVTPEPATALFHAVAVSAGVNTTDIALPAPGQTTAAEAAVEQAVTAGQRDPGWMAAYGCTPNCVMDHAQPDSNPGWHQGAAAVLPAPGRLGTNLPGEDDEPLFDARVTTVNQDSHIFGVRTSLWVDLVGDTMELDLAEVDGFIAGLEAFLPRLRALRAELAEVARGDLPENAEARARWHAEHAARAAAERAQIAREVTRQDGGRR
jgi:hypothetical protein